jgi:hypothetical protein
LPKPSITSGLKRLIGSPGDYNVNIVFDHNKKESVGCPSVDSEVAWDSKGDTVYDFPMSNSSRSALLNDGGGVPQTIAFYLRTGDHDVGSAEFVVDAARMNHADLNYVWTGLVDSKGHPSGDLLVNVSVVGDILQERKAQHHRPTEPSPLVDSFLRIAVNEARGLLNVERVGMSDPYAVVKVGPYKFKTHRKDNTLTPKWDEQFDVDLKGILNYLPMDQSSYPFHIEVAIYDHDTIGSDSFLGKAFVQIHNFVQGRKYVEWQTLADEHNVRDKNRGEVKLTCQIKSLHAKDDVDPSPEVVSGVSMEGTLGRSRAQDGDLKLQVFIFAGRDLNDLANPFVRVQCEGSNEYSLDTKPCASNPHHPFWMESLTFSFPREVLSNMTDAFNEELMGKHLQLQVVGRMSSFGRVSEKPGGSMQVVLSDIASLPRPKSADSPHWQAVGPENGTGVHSYLCFYACWKRPDALWAGQQVDIFSGSMNPHVWWQTGTITEMLEERDRDGDKCAEVAIDGSDEIRVEKDTALIPISSDATLPASVSQQAIFEQNTKPQMVPLEQPRGFLAHQGGVVVEEVNEKDVDSLLEIIGDIFRDAHDRGLTMHDQFNMFDTNGSGILSHDEFGKGLAMLGVQVLPRELTLLMERFTNSKTQVKLDGQEASTLVCDEGGVRYRAFIKTILGYSFEEVRDELLQRIRAVFMKELPKASQNDIVDPNGKTTALASILSNPLNVDRCLSLHMK